MTVEYSEKYLHLGESVDPDAHVICTYKITTDMDIRLAAAAVATEQSTGTWTGISTLNDEIFKRYHGRVIDIKGNVATIAYPEDDFSLDIGGVPQILSVIAGNLFGAFSVRMWYFAGIAAPYNSGRGCSPAVVTISGTASSHSMAMM